MRKLFGLMALVLFLAGCETREALPFIPPNDLCEKIKFRGWLGFDSDIQEEAFDRGLMKIGDWARIRSGRITKGMSDCAAVAILGLPGKVAQKPFAVGKPNRLWFYEKGKSRGLRYILDIKWGQVDVCRRPEPGSDRTLKLC
jgi:hypothetical protein